MQKYVHYGCSSFDREKFVPISNNIEIPKPNGGLWASRVDAKFGWKDWCEGTKGFEDTLEQSFEFELKPDARVLVIDNISQLDDLPKGKSLFDVLKEQGVPMDFHKGLWTFLDFEKLAEDYDAVEVIISADHNLHFQIYTWDCDAIVVMNPDVIVAL